MYDYLPGAESLHSRHLQGGRRARAVQEDLLWDYLIQLVATLRVVHSAGLALHCLQPSKILVTGYGRSVLMFGVSSDGSDGSVCVCVCVCVCVPSALGWE